MILSHEDLSAIEKTLGAHQAGPIVQALEKLDKEQRVEVKRDLLIELATKADIVRMEGKIDQVALTTKADIIRIEGKIDQVALSTKVDIANLKADIEKRLVRMETLMKVLIGLSVLAMGLFSPAGVELIKLVK